jgi:hypothetical protein
LGLESWSGWGRGQGWVWDRGQDSFGLGKGWGQEPGWGCIWGQGWVCDRGKAWILDCYLCAFCCVLTVIKIQLFGFSIIWLVRLFVLLNTLSSFCPSSLCLSSVSPNLVKFCPMVSIDRIMN